MEPGRHLSIKPLDNNLRDNTVDKEDRVGLFSFLFYVFSLVLVFLFSICSLFGRDSTSHRVGPALLFFHVVTCSVARARLMAIGLVFFTFVILGLFW